MKTKLVASLSYKTLRYPKNHPLRIPRVSLLLEFLKAMDLLQDSEVCESREATLDELLLFHTEDYLEALQEADRCMCSNSLLREKYNIGTYENPVSPAMWRGSLLATGSSIQATELFLSGILAFNPAGGMHHAYPSRANGFCFINDPGVTIQYLLKKGYKRILYIDLDAHHCDGVQDFFYHTNEVFVLSIHQSPEYAFPFKKGYIHERGEGKGEGYNLNVPLPKGINDGEYLTVLDKTLELVKDVFEPDVYVLQLGTDTLKEDYLSKFEITNTTFLQAFRMVRDCFGEGIYLGGGGYHPIALARAWALIWCDISGREIPKKLTQKAKEVLLSVEFEEFDDEVDRSYMYESLVDPPGEFNVRGEVKKLLQELKAFVL